MDVKTNEFTILNARATTGFGTAVNVKNFDSITILLSFPASSTATARIVGSAQQDEPAWATAQSGSNHHDNVAAIDAQTGTLIAGDTGVAVSNAADVRTLVVDTRGLTWINVNVAIISAGSVSARAIATDLS